HHHRTRFRALIRNRKPPAGATPASDPGRRDGNAERSGVGSKIEGRETDVSRPDFFRARLVVTVLLQCNIRHTEIGECIRKRGYDPTPRHAAWGHSGLLRTGTCGDVAAWRRRSFG